jgi:hypothetical protein
VLGCQQVQHGSCEYLNWQVLQELCCGGYESKAANNSAM